MSQNEGIMADRELLELAAKAIGFPLRFNSLGLPDARDEWNPLTDDGDALRLVVKLNVHITSSATDAWATTQAVTAIQPIGSDPYAATRRAIVRAAAAIAQATGN